MIIGTAIFLVICVTLAFISVYFHQKKEWNNGTCKDCNSEYKLLAEEQDGSRCYVCNCPSKFLWITYKRFK